MPPKSGVSGTNDSIRDRVVLGRGAVGASYRIESARPRHPTPTPRHGDQTRLDRRRTVTETSGVTVVSRRPIERSSAS